MAGDLPDFTQAVTSPVTHLATVPVGAGAVGTANVIPPTGTMALGFATRKVAGGVPRVTLVYGHTSGVEFWQQPGNSSLTATMMVAPVAFDPSFDASIDVDWDNTGLVAGSFDIFAVLAPMALAHGLLNPLEVAIQGNLGSGLQQVQLSSPLDQQTRALSVAMTPPSDLPLGKAGQLASAASLPVVLASDQPAIPGGAYRSGPRAALFNGPTKSTNVSQASANLNVDLVLANLGNAPIIYGIDLVMLNTVATGGAWATVRLHNATAAINLWLTVLEADKNGSGFPYRAERTWIWGEQPLEPALVGGTNAQAWTLVVNASLTGVFWGCAVQYA